MKREIKKYTAEEKRKFIEALRADIATGTPIITAAKKIGLSGNTAYTWMQRDKATGGGAAKARKPYTKKEVIVVNSDEEKESEDVKIVVMKGPGHVIEKIAAALSGVL